MAALLEAHRAGCLWLRSSAHSVALGQILVFFLWDGTVERITYRSPHDKSEERVRYSDSLVNLEGLFEKEPSLDLIRERSGVQKGTWT